MTCTFPNCECQHPPEKCFFKPENQVTSERINSTEFPRLKRIEKEKEFWEQEIKDNPNHPTNMYCEREISRLKRLMNDPAFQEVMDVLDGPDQECYPLCEDEGCPHFDTPHVCINLDKPID